MNQGTYKMISNIIVKFARVHNNNNNNKISEHPQEMQYLLNILKFIPDHE